MSFADPTPDFTVQQGQERDTAFPEFRLQPIQNGPKTLEHGHPVFDEVEFVTIRVPGDRKTEWDGRVTDVHRRRFAPQYAAWKQGLEAPTEGFPLSEWAGVTRGQVEELAFGHVKTVEQLAILPDDALNRTIAMGGFQLREKARQYLAQAKESAPAQKLAAEVEIRDAKISELEGQVAALSEQVAGLLAAKET